MVASLFFGIFLQTLVARTALTNKPASNSTPLSPSAHHFVSSSHHAWPILTLFLPVRLQEFSVVAWSLSKSTVSTVLSFWSLSFLLTLFYQKGNKRGLGSGIQAKVCFMNMVFRLPPYNTRLLIKQRSHLGLGFLSDLFLVRKSKKKRGRRGQVPPFTPAKCQ
ncbi:hypothetical protein B0T20DRAFT_410548 [Sordaria brevicollis]|uniref:Secreted protein n=1 Tax=Sordaria brevicollis TaxID=83679 RepID=A0AAE0PEB6_SORBR|nr:hypothetical protein B0T20DRAFT_410548 [Sordaria brevicollis]